MSYGKTKSEICFPGNIYRLSSKDQRWKFSHSAILEIKIKGSRTASLHKVQIHHETGTIESLQGQEIKELRVYSDRSLGWPFVAGKRAQRFAAKGHQSGDWILTITLIRAFNSPPRMFVFDRPPLAVGVKNIALTQGNSFFLYDELSTKLRSRWSESLSFNLARPILFNTDRNILLQSSYDPQSIEVMDIERTASAGKWRLQAMGDISCIAVDPNRTLKGGIFAATDQTLLRFDMRASKPDKWRVQSNRYAGKENFKMITPTYGGILAVLSEGPRRAPGVVRLYKEHDIMGRASAKFSFQSDIYHIDASPCGGWIVATCESRLILVNLSSKSSSPQTILALPSNSPVYHRVKSIRFSPARFSRQHGQQAIVTSTGNFIIRWVIKQSRHDSGWKGQFAAWLVQRPICDITFTQHGILGVVIIYAGANTGPQWASLDPENLTDGIQRIA